MATAPRDELEEKRERLREWISKGKIESPAQGVNHVAVFAKDLEITAEFYTNVLSMPVVSVTSNRDVPESTHVNVDIGGGTLISFFDFPHVPRLQRSAPEGVGGIMHLAIPVPSPRLKEVKSSFGERGIQFQEIGGALYFNDPNGLGIELMQAS